MKRFALTLAALALAAALVAALVGTDDSAERCFKEQGEAAVAACTHAIQSGRFSGAQLASIYDNRAIELRQLGDYDRAIEDYSAALRIDADLTGAYTGRGLAYEGKADVDKAKGDYAKALAVAQEKEADDPWAQDTARERLAALTER
jgi:tetratricopeptide (TPR) repeat protein